MSNFFCDSMQMELQRRMETFDGAGNLAECRFERDNGLVPQLRHARKYVAHWKEMRQRGMGLLFWGPPGNGKTFAAACIAGHFVASREPFTPSVIMTTFGVILRRSLALSPQEREDYIMKLIDCDLLILDDFGMERQTEYAREQVFNIINGRYLAGTPMIVTTNLTLQQMKNPETMAEKRIFDRVLEVCVPVYFDGESLRTAKAADNLRFYRELMENAGS